MNSQTFCSSDYFSISRDSLYFDTRPSDHIICILFIFVPCYKQLSDEVFVISGIMKVEVSVIRQSQTHIALKKIRTNALC